MAGEEGGDFSLCRGGLASIWWHGWVGLSVFWKNCVPTIFKWAGMERMCVSSCKCWMGVVLVHPVIILRAVFCVTYNLFKLDCDSAGNHAGEA